MSEFIQKLGQVRREAGTKQLSSVVHLLDEENVFGEDVVRIYQTFKQRGECLQRALLKAEIPIPWQLRLTAADLEQTIRERLTQEKETSMSDSKGQHGTLLNAANSVLPLLFCFAGSVVCYTWMSPWGN
uniref:AlNc14C91G5680 protein n=1 Tax=Albugo laibachii Nc14 TaxID=890382 RepID=F0WGE8_9STRA|nr:AlNc14C91G5680 [Albugo laibachii Nc14]|eukprot:CCA20309.1 AlNc14C91G5680 [Albugo laibachii Nc14]